MKFGLFSHVPWPEDLDPKQKFDQTTEEAVYGEELGFNSIWLAEHHFTRYGLGSSSLVLASSIAARTKKIRLGTAVLVPTLHHPLRLAEDTATLDVISDGRLDVGYGRGAAGYEYTTYMVDREESQERFREAIGMIEGLWTTPEYTYQGKFYNVNRANLVPPPVQKPHPPVYIAATRTPETMEFVRIHRAPPHNGGGVGQFRRPRSLPEVCRSVPGVGPQRAHLRHSLLSLLPRGRDGGTGPPQHRGGPELDHGR